MNKKIYLDNASTTKVDEKVLIAMLPYLKERYGNASSQHFFGRQAREAIESAREVIAKSINALPEEVIFTSGGTEANNFVLKELFFSNMHNGKKHIITTKIEHDSILNVCRWLETRGAEVTYLDVNEDGFVDLNKLRKTIKKETLLVSVIHGNNEIGTIQNIKEIGEICREKNVYFHIDACQSYTKSEIDVKNQNLSFATLNAHKIHGPKGIGALYIKKGIKLEPLLHGGGHEGGLRSGTENVAAIVGFSKAVKISKKGDKVRMEKLRDYVIKEVLKIQNTKLNGTNKNRLCNNINISFENIEGESILSTLEEKGIIISTGSACASHKLERSHVLRAIGLEDNNINSSIRVSLSRYTTKGEIIRFVKELKKAVKKLREMSPFN